MVGLEVFCGGGLKRVGSGIHWGARIFLVYLVNCYVRCELFDLG